MQIIDLTLPFTSGEPQFPGDPPVTLVRTRSHDTDGYEVTQICLGSHSGTHLDAPRHFFPAGATLDQYPVDRLIGPGVVVDCRPGAKGDGTDPATRARGASFGADEVGAGTIGAALLAERLRRFPIPRGGSVLLWTEGALLTVDAGHVLLGLGPGLVGTDASSLDAEPYPVHRLLLGRGVLIAENLRGLDRLGPGCVTCAFLPLAVAGTDGAPVRAVAWR
jgi:arylformamidase